MRVPFGVGLPVLACLALLPGCSGPGRVEVQGTVTYQGQPIKAGSIVFRSADGQGLSSGESIVDGSYHIPAPVGPMSGKYQVVVHWHKPTGKSYRSETGAVLQVTEEGLPPRYNEQTELTADLKPGKNQLDFTLK